METFEIKINNTKILYSLETEIERKWFGPMIRSKKLHEDLVSRIIISLFKTSNCFLDIGANIGFYSILSTVLNPSISSHAFEIDPSIAAIIAKNARLNNIENLKIIPVAVWNQTGDFVTFSPTQENNPSTNSISDTSLGNSFRCPTVSLDDYCQISKIEPDIVKIDVEGVEVKVIKAMKQTILTTKTLFLEIHPEQIIEAGDDISEIISFLESNRFNVRYAIDHKRSKSLKQLSNLAEITKFSQNAMLVCSKDSF